jgi:hypothetical protein
MNSIGICCFNILYPIFFALVGIRLLDYCVQAVSNLKIGVLIIDFTQKKGLILILFLIKFAQVFCSKLEKSKPLVVAMDDSIIKKVGTKIHGVAYRRDPMGPPFQVNFIRGQRVLQISAAVPSDSGSARMIPISFSHAPSVKKPNSKASPELQEQYKEEKKTKKSKQTRLETNKEP